MDEEIKESKDNKDEGKIKSKKNKLYNFFKYFSIILLIGIMIILGIYKYNTPSFQIKWFFIIGGIGAIIVLILFFGTSFFNYIKKKEKEENIISFEEASLLANEIVEDKLFDIVTDVEDEGVEEHGENSKQEIYFKRCIGLLGEKMNQRYFIAINLHSPNINRRVIVNPTDAQIREIKKKLASDPEKSPEREVIRRRNPLLGTEEEIMRTKPKKIEEVKKEEKEDLV